MAARDHLLENESILSACPPFYATNRRLLRCENAQGREEFYDLPYPRIEAVELVRQPRQRLALGGVAVAFAGVMLWAMGFITAMPAILVGLGMIVWGARGQQGYYQFKGYQMSPEELARWQVQFRGSAGLIATIGEYVHRPLQWS